MSYRFVAAVAIAVLGLSACATATPAPAPPAATGENATPTAAAPTTGAASPTDAGATGGAASPSPAADDQTVRPGGLGPYRIGGSLDDLRAKGHLATPVKTTGGCPDYATSTGRPEYNSPDLVFYQKKLIWLSLSSPQARTPEGAHVGTPLAEAKKRHPDGRELSDGLGGRAWLVTQGKNALLLRIGSGGAVTLIEAGVAETLEFRFTEGEGC
ncbi:hypothetical protein AB0C02_30580 [Micromonospora sp. NPDC048999]|uniref:hypothetical protein n=1 Tax=Micromonospora sp. NPDC048999 TaxID=3155391 RepID=UPI0033C42C24